MHLTLGLALGGGCTFPAGGDVTAPVRAGAPVIDVSGLTITITYNETLDPASVPTLTLAGTASVVSSVNVTGNTVVGTLNVAALVSEVITVSSSGAPIQDLAGNDAAGLSSVSVTNNSTVGSGTALLDWSEAQFNRRHDSSIGTTYQTGAAAYSLASADTYRSEDTGDGHGALLLCEGQRACINIQSRALHSWTSDNGATSVADTHTSPDGGTNADSITFAATTISGKSKAQTGTNVPSSTNLAFQCWAKSGTAGDEKFRFHLTDKDAFSPTTVDQTVNQSWQRYTWDKSSGAGSGNPTLRIWNASDAAGRGAGRIVIVGSMCVEAAPFPSSLILNETGAQNGKRYEDLMILTPEQVPLRLREGKWSTAARVKWATADLAGLSAYVVSFGSASDGLRFRHNGTDLRLEAVVGGVVVASSGAITVARGGYLTIVVDCAAGIITVNGVAGSTGSAIVWPGGVLARWGGVIGATGSEAFAAFDLPRAA